jgi:hypothetical protein
VKDGTEVLIIPSFVPQKMISDLYTPPVIPYLVYKGVRRAIEILPHATDEELMEMATIHLRPKRESTWEQVAYSVFGVAMNSDETPQSVKGGEFI